MKSNFNSNSRQNYRSKEAYSRVSKQNGKNSAELRSIHYEADSIRARKKRLKKIRNLRQTVYPNVIDAFKKILAKLRIPYAGKIKILIQILALKCVERKHTTYCAVVIDSSGFARVMYNNSPAAMAQAALQEGKRQQFPFIITVNAVNRNVTIIEWDSVRQVYVPFSR